MNNWYDHEKQEQHKTSYKKPCTQWPVNNPGLLRVMESYLERRELSHDLAIFCGWYPTTSANDDYPRVLIPAEMSRPRGIYWQARALYDNVKLRYQSPPSNREDAVVVVSKFRRAESWYRREFDTRISTIAITEGPLDALAAAKCVDAAFALMGNDPPQMVWNYIKTICSHEEIIRVILVGDTDSPQAASKWLLQAQELGDKIQLVFPYPEKDLAECSFKKRRKLLA